MSADEGATAVGREGHLSARYAPSLRWGLNIPVSYGGSDASLTAIIETIRVMARTDLTAPAILSSHLRAAQYLVSFGSPNQRQRLLPRLASGEMVAAHALSERVGPTGSRMQTAIECVEGKYFLTGRKHWVTNARDSDVIVVVARHPCGEGLSGVMIPRERFPEIALVDLERGGMHGVSLCEVTWADYRLDPEHDLIGGLAADLKPNVVAATGGKYLNFAARAVGVAEAIESETKEILGSREAPAHPLALYRFGELSARVFAAQAVLTHVLHGMDDKAPLLEETMAARLFCTRALTEVIEHATNLLGGVGYAAPRNRLAEILRDASSLGIAGTPLDRLGTELGGHLLAER